MDGYRLAICFQFATSCEFCESEFGFRLDAVRSGHREHIQERFVPGDRAPDPAMADKAAVIDNEQILGPGCQPFDLPLVEADLANHERVCSRRLAQDISQS